MYGTGVNWDPLNFDSNNSNYEWGERWRWACFGEAGWGLNKRQQDSGSCAIVVVCGAADGFAEVSSVWFVQRRESEGSEGGMEESVKALSTLFAPISTPMRRRELWKCTMSTVTRT